MPLTGSEAAQGPGSGLGLSWSQWELGELEGGHTEEIKVSVPLQGLREHSHTRQKNPHPAVFLLCSLGSIYFLFLFFCPFKLRHLGPSSDCLSPELEEAALEALLLCPVNWDPESTHLQPRELGLWIWCHGFWLAVCRRRV